MSFRTFPRDSWHPANGLKTPLIRPRSLRPGDFWMGTLLFLRFWKVWHQAGNKKRKEEVQMIGYHAMRLSVVLFGLSLAACGGGGGGNSSSGGNETILDIVPMTPATISVHANGDALVIDPLGRYAYMPYEGEDESDPDGISVFSLGGNGALSYLADVSVADGVYGLAIDPEGTYAWVATENKLMRYIVGSDGLLDDSVEKASLPDVSYIGGITLSPDGKSLYATYEKGTDSGWAGGLQLYTVDANHDLSLVGTLIEQDYTDVSTIALTPNGKFAYVPLAVSDPNTGNSTSKIVRYDVAGDGSLTNAITVVDPTDDEIDDMRVDPTGDFAFVQFETDTDSSFSYEIKAYRISSSGDLTLVKTLLTQADEDISNVALDTTGHYAYITNSDSAQISQYTVVGK